MDMDKKLDVLRGKCNRIEKKFSEVWIEIFFKVKIPMDDYFIIFKSISNMVSMGLGLFNFTISRLIELLFLKVIYFEPLFILL